MVRTTSSSRAPAVCKTAFRLSRAQRAWASRPSASWPVTGSSPIWPEQKTRSFAATRIAWLYGPMAAGAASVWMTFLSLIPGA